MKWLTRIEVIDSRFEGPFMAQRYMTVREVPRPDGTTVWTRTAVGKSLLKSIPAMVTVQDGKYRIYGAAWGAPIGRAEVRLDDGPWKPAPIDRGAEHEFAWKFWHLDWSGPAAGEHRITSRAIDRSGAVQPAGDDASVAKRHTYWEANEQITRTIRIAWRACSGEARGCRPADRPGRSPSRCPLRGAQKGLNRRDSRATTVRGGGRVDPARVRSSSDRTLKEEP